MERALTEHKLEMTKLRYSLNKQHGKNKLTDDNFDMYEKKVVEAVVDIKKNKDDFQEKLDQILQQSYKMQSKKMYHFCDIIIREFKYMNKLQEDKILFEVGYNDKLKHPLPHAKPGELFDELLSTSSVPTFTFLDE